MASRLYLRNLTTVYGSTPFHYLLGARGPTAASWGVNLANGGSNIQWTQSPGGTLATWIGPRAPAEGATIASTITFNTWGSESATNDECTFTFRLFRFNAASSTETEFPGSPFTLGTELFTTTSTASWSAAPSSSVALAEDDRIIARLYADPRTGGTMTSGTANLRLNGPNAAADGDTYLEFFETIAWKTETITRTVKTSGGDYTLVTNWEAAFQMDLVAAPVIAAAECYAGSYSDAIILAGWTTGPDNYISIYAPLAERHNGTFRNQSGIGTSIINNTTTVLQVRTDYVRLAGLEMHCGGGASGTIVNTGGTIAAANELLIDSCIVGCSTTAQALNLTSDLDQRAIIRNSLFFTFLTPVTVRLANIAYLEFSHNVVHSSTAFNGMEWGPGAGDTHILYNNWFSNAGTGAALTRTVSGGTETGSNNASDDTSAAFSTIATGALINVTTVDQFVDTTMATSTINFTLKAGSVLENGGIFLANVSTDFEGEARSSTPDIGADEFTPTEFAVNSDYLAIWSIHERINKSYEGLWSIQEGISKTLESLWNIQERVNKSYDALWNMEERINKGYEASWNIEERINKAYEMLWNTEELIQKTYEIIYNMEGGEPIRSTRHNSQTTFRRRAGRSISLRGRN